jgi:hypothetical protein
VPHPLGPPRGVHRTKPRCCEACRYLTWLPGYALCRRPGGRNFDIGDGEYLYMVCDGWRAPTGIADALDAIEEEG